MSASNKRVHFLPEKDRIVEIQSRKDYTKREIQDSWYSKSQLHEVAMRRCTAALEWEADNNNKASTTGLYLRGLEQYTKRGEKIASKSIALCIDAVMDEQEVQWSKGEDDYDRFAVVSQRVSKFSIGLALLQAEKDEVEAQKVYESILKEQIRKSKKHHSKKSGVPKEPITTTVDDASFVVDDHTSVCSDLSHPELDSSFHIIEDSCEDNTTIESSSLECCRHVRTTIPATKNNQNNNKNNGTESSNLSRRVKNAKVLNKLKSIPRRSSNICKSFKTKNVNKGMWL